MMIEIIDEVLEITKDLNSRMDSIVYDELLDLVDLRTKLVSFLDTKPVLSQTEKEKLKLLSSYDQVIVTKMETFKQEAKVELIKLNQGKVQQKGYNVQYQPDSYFYDKRQ